MSEEILYSIALRKSPLIGDINFRKLIQLAGSAKEAWHLRKDLLMKADGIGAQIVKELGNDDYLTFAEKELQYCEKNNIRIRLRHLNELPNLLSECEDAPAVLYQKGNWDETRTNLSVVGTRNATAYGRSFITELCAELKGKPVTVVSGLALGTDGHAHAEALQNRLPTVAVLAHGFHRLYPAKHRALAERILADNGALLTEFNSSQDPNPENFIRRNRIVAGLSPITVVTESAYGGGSISTAGFANQYNREVFALPGKITDRYSQGCNMLIALHKARIIVSRQDVIDELQPELTPQVGSLFSPKEIPAKLTEEQELLFCAIRENDGIQLDDLAVHTALPTHKLMPLLLQLEMDGHIRTLSGRQYQVT
ncbi:MAG: DNA-protecting protein DprA [Chryseobacterium sp.]|nr:MAG: DNA-protecting protein DprA [Chryseobacterium sp.]